jgi:hypothetical protein
VPQDDERAAEYEADHDADEHDHSGPPSERHFPRVAEPRDLPPTPSTVSDLLSRAEGWGPRDFQCSAQVTSGWRFWRVVGILPEI